MSAFHSLTLPFFSLFMFGDSFTYLNHANLLELFYLQDRELLRFLITTRAPSPQSPFKIYLPFSLTASGLLTFLFNPFLGLPPFSQLYRQSLKACCHSVGTVSCCFPISAVRMQRKFERCLWTLLYSEPRRLSAMGLFLLRSSQQFFLLHCTPVSYTSSSPWGFSCPLLCRAHPPWRSFQPQSPFSAAPCVHLTTRSVS